MKGAEGTVAVVVAVPVPTQKHAHICHAWNSSVFTSTLSGDTETCHRLTLINVITSSHLDESEERKVKVLVANICRNAEDGHRRSCF